MDFVGFPKMPRLNRECVITEKIDGTNAQICIVPHHEVTNRKFVYNNDEFAIYAGSRTRWITPEDDNYGFARWVKENAEELLRLGKGQHFGEWWGKGIQRGYNVPDKRFSLFNTNRWTEENKPNCCLVVPILYQGLFNTSIIQEIVNNLEDHGSKAAPGYDKPEGVIIYHTALNHSFKVTIEGDEQPKSLYKG